MKDPRILIAYYSRRGENYVGGKILNLVEGNMEVVAMKIQTLVGGDLFQIETTLPYPSDYEKATEVSRRELKANARPEILGRVEGMDTYEVIILGYPNWWGTMPMAVFTFLESHDLAGKTILPLCTHEGSGLGRSELDIQKLCPLANVLPGLAIRGGEVRNSDSVLRTWLHELQMQSIERRK